jgi:NitT/TauT family transport system substrate-binding protein
MTDAEPAVDPVTDYELRRPEHWGRRDFVKGLGALAGSAGLLGFNPRPAAAEPPPQTTRLRIHENWITCLAPQIVVQELLYSEGFKDVQYVKYLKDTQHFPPEDLLAGEVDITFSFSPTDIQFIDAGAPLTILAAAHTGCVELIASKRTAAACRGFQSDQVAVIAAIGPSAWIRP